MKARVWSLGMSSLAVTAAFALAFSSLTAQAGDKEKKGFKAACPLSGRPASKEFNVDYFGRKVYFCCKNCPKGFEKKTTDHDNLDEKLMAKVAHQFVQTGQAAQIGCPFSGRAVKEDTVVDLKGAKIGFCCKNCKGKFAKTPDDEKLALVFNKETIQKGFTLQTKCPLSGKPIDASISTDYKDKKVYFCCPGCEAPFKKDPAKFMAKLPQFDPLAASYKSGSCCSKSFAASAKCSHPCCETAAKAGKVCTKCNKV